MNRILFAFLLCLIGFTSQAGRIVLEGNYQGKNLYVQNPYAGSGVGYCAYRVYVNGNISPDEVNSSAFEIDFKPHSLSIGDEVTVVIEHKDDCVPPKVLNPEVLKPKSTFKILTMSIDDTNVMSWKAVHESGILPYVVEQFRWNKWVKIGEVDGEGTPGEHSYQFEVALHSGVNKFRVTQTDYTGRARNSKFLTHSDPSVKQVTFSPKSVRSTIEFSDSTKFEIYDEFGNIVRKGYKKQIDCKDLKKGAYYLNFDNVSDDFIKR